MKKFLIIGNMNAITYKEVFPLIKDNKIWTGYKCFGGGMNMIQPEDTFDESKTKSFTINEKGEIIKNIMGVIWYTNLDHKKRHKPLELTKTYDPAKYPRYDNYDAIEVSKVADIPMDYDGVMGVPITFIDKYCPEQFKILDARDYGILHDAKIDDKTKYCRALNQRSNEMNARPVINGKETYRRVLNENSIPQTYVNGEKKYARVFNEHSGHPNPLAGGGQINGRITYKRIPIIRVKKDDNQL